MATKTGGTLATTTLTVVQYFPDMAAADLATIALGIFRDCGQAEPPGTGGGFAPAQKDGQGNAPAVVFPAGFTRQGLLTLPLRCVNGPTNLQPGDWIAIDGFGNAFLIPQRAMPKTLTQSVTLTNASSKVTSTVDIRTLGWQNGTHVTSAHTPNNAIIANMGPDGKSFTLASAVTGLALTATGSATETMTAGTFTHS